MARTPNDTIRTALLALTLLLGVGGCDSPAAPEGHATGVVLLNASGAEAARFTFPPATASGQLAVGVGSQATYRVMVLLDDGSTRAVDGVEYAIAQPSVVIALAAQIALAGVDQLRITGGPTARNSSIVFQLQHAGHTEFTVRDIELRIQ